ncbi:response regulator transcription factor [Anaerotignum sp.]|uniref:response regulator transcription factor n=1 Tax=Anaerotignum sp. TaxID=2039241 RepID=UPI0027147982|nr:response regulator transcription factor [Anaerotignum sp.]
MKKATILMVEDEADVLAINQEFFEGKGYAVVGADTLKQARFQLEEHNPDLILLDAMMPDGSGFAFCDELRQKTNAPIIFLTCRNENKSIVQGLLLGGDDYVTKPYDLNVLSARVGAQLRRTGNMTAGKIEIPPLTIDFLLGMVTLENEPISLTQKEIQLLGCLALFAGRRLSYDEIYRRAWGGSSPGAAHTVAVHVANLRKKLGENGRSWFDLTNSGKGEYIFSKIRY